MEGELTVNSFDMAKIMSVLSKMDKKDLEEGIAKAQKILQSKNSNEIINDIKNSGNNR